MNVPSMNSGASAAAVVYAERLEGLNASQLADQRRDRLFGMAKLAAVVSALVAAACVFRYFVALAPLLGLAAAFVVLVIAHEKVLERVRRRKRIIQFYESGVARLNGEWAGHGATGARYLDASHVYARDLDLFGVSSLFQYCCSARTRAGEDTLARWLLEPAPVDQILARQEAVRDLAGRLKFREQIASAGEIVRDGVRPEELSAWGEREPILTSTLTCALTTTLALLWIASIVFWIASGSPFPTLLISVLNFAYAHKLFPRLERAAEAIEKAADDLQLLAEVLAVIEREAFTAPLLVELKLGLERAGSVPSAAILKLAKLTEAIRSRHSLFGRSLDLVTFWSAQYVFVIEKWQRKFGPALRRWLDAVGELEAYASISAFCYEHPEHAFPEFFATGPLFEAEGLAHPLLSSYSAVENDVKLSPGRQLMILSGPNMAGKSTFIRSIGVNTVLAQCGAPVRARRLRLSQLRVAASICIPDSLSGGVSRFYAEIRRVKAIVDLADGSIPVLFLFDELLSGTNSHDRFVGTQFVLQQLVGLNAIGIVSTHDLALARIPDTMESRAFNAHFEDRLEGGNLIFDYKLKPGVVETTNALKLMRAIGLSVSDG